MERYYVNQNTDTNPKNDHEVHKESCRLLPLRDKIDLGYHNNCQSALGKASQYYYNVDGCRVCIPECHRG